VNQRRVFCWRTRIVSNLVFAIRGSFTMPSASDRPNLSVEQTDAGTVVHLIGCASLNEQSTPAVEEQLLSLAAEVGAAALLVDLGQVRYMSSIALGMLIGLRQKMRASRGQLTLLGVSPDIFELFDATRLTRLLNVQQDGKPSATANG
jgi:anti-anti-sigma factor